MICFLLFALVLAWFLVQLLGLNILVLLLAQAQLPAFFLALIHVLFYRHPRLFHLLFALLLTLLLTLLISLTFAQVSPHFNHFNLHCLLDKTPLASQPKKRSKPTRKQINRSIISKNFNKNTLVHHRQGLSAHNFFPKRQAIFLFNTLFHRRQKLNIIFDSPESVKALRKTIAPFNTPCTLKKLIFNFRRNDLLPRKVCVEDSDEDGKGARLESVVWDFSLILFPPCDKEEGNFSSFTSPFNDPKHL
jgi:hypothetical protein